MVSPTQAGTNAHDTATAPTPTSSISTTATGTPGTPQPTELPHDNQKKVCPPATVGLEYQISQKTLRIRVDSGNDEDTCVIDAYNIQWSTTADFQPATTKHHVHSVKHMHSLMLQPATQSQSQSVAPSRHHSRPLHTTSSDIFFGGHYLLPSLSYHVRVMGLMKHENNTYDMSIPLSQDPDVVEIPTPIDMGDNPIIWYEMILNLTSATAEKDIRDYYKQQKVDFITGIINDVGGLLQVDNAREHIYPNPTFSKNHYSIKIQGSHIAQQFMEFFILTGVGEGKDGIEPTHRTISSSSRLFQNIQGIIDITWLIQCPHSGNIIWKKTIKECQHVTTNQDPLGGFFSIHPILSTMLVVAAIAGALLCMMFRKGSYQTTSNAKFVPVDSADMDDDMELGHSSKPLSSHVVDDDDDDDNCDGDHGTRLKPVAVGLDI